MSFQSENERNKAVVDAFYQLGIQGRLTDFAQYLDPNFTWTAPNYLPWGGTHTGAALFRGKVLSSLPDVFDFARFSYISVIAEDGRVDAVINQGVKGTDAVIKVVDCWTVRDGKVTSIWVAYFEPQALLDKLGIAHGLGPLNLSALEKGKAMEQTLSTTSKPIKVPGPDHPITVERNPNRVVISLAGHVIADTRDALTLRESTYPPVQYVPRKDVDMTLLERTDHATYCPYKGHASYFSIPAGGARSANGVWSYEAPYAAVALIKDYLAFYPDRVDAIEERAGA